MIFARRRRPVPTPPLPPCEAGEVYPRDLAKGMRVIFPGESIAATVSMPGTPDSNGTQMVLSDDGGHCEVWIVGRGQRLRLEQTVACVRDEMSDLMAKAARKPAWLYASGCCGNWTPEGGCRYHTGRSAMSLRARELG